MADFRIRKDCRDWFHRISEGSDWMVFDPYYLCFLLGVAAGHRRRPTEGGIEAAAFVDSFPRPYDQQHRLILGFMLSAELKRARIDVKDRSSVNIVVNGLAGAAGLTANGVSVMNEYASGGFDVLLSEYPGDEPWSLEEFLPRYLQLLDDLMDQKRLEMQW